MTFSVRYKLEANRKFSPVVYSVLRSFQKVIWCCFQVLSAPWPCRCTAPRGTRLPSFLAPAGELQGAQGYGPYNVSSWVRGKGASSQQCKKSSWNKNISWHLRWKKANPDSKPMSKRCHRNHLSFVGLFYFTRHVSTELTAFCKGPKEVSACGLPALHWLAEVAPGLSSKAAERDALATLVHCQQPSLETQGCELWCWERKQARRHRRPWLGMPSNKRPRLPVHSKPDV